jgi:ABC-2 type transport system permease protein
MMVGFRPLFVVTAKQDARNIAPWIVLITALSASSILAYSWVFPDPMSRAALSVAVGANPAFSLLFGQARDLSTAEGSMRGGRWRWAASSPR